MHAQGVADGKAALIKAQTPNVAVVAHLASGDSVCGPASLTRLTRLTRKRSPTPRRAGQQRSGAQALP